MNVVLDASAVIAFLRGESGADVVEHYFGSETHSLYIHALNLCEIYYDFLRAAGEASAESAVQDILLLGVHERNDMNPDFWYSFPPTGTNSNLSLAMQSALRESRAIALKESVAWQIQQAMEKGKIGKVEMARRMNTSRADLDRFLGPGNASVTLQTLTKAARAIGRDLRIELV